MSVKKSWDIQPRRPASAPAARPVSQRGGGRQETTPRPAVRAVVRKPTQRTPSRANERLRDRRKKQKRFFFVLLGILLVCIITGLIYMVHRPGLRVQKIDVQGSHQQDIAALAQSELEGTYFHIIPKDSIFFFSTSHIRAAILQDFPNVEAVSINRESFSTISIIPTERSTAFLWCGVVKPAAGQPESCYDADSDGFLFAAAMESDALATPASTTDGTNGTNGDASPDGMMKIYAALDASSSDAQADPIRSYVIHADTVPGALEFTKALATLGARISYIVIRDDEADLYVTGGTRITYVLGHEQDAAALAEAVIPKVDMTNGSIAYLDLRFSGKAYIQRQGAPDQGVAPTAIGVASTTSQ